MRKNLKTGARSIPWLRRLYSLFPTGWADNAIAFSCQRQQSDIIDCVDVKGHRIHAAKMEAAQRELKGRRATPFNLLAKTMLPEYTSIAVKDARLQASLDEACVACALERYFLENQAYPAQLDALVPAYLARVPTDVIDGASLRYETIAKGRYRLWEVGWDGQDDDADVVWKSRTRLDDKASDWVWQYEAITRDDAKN